MFKKQLLNGTEDDQVTKVSNHKCTFTSNSIYPQVVVKLFLTTFQIMKGCITQGQSHYSYHYRVNKIKHVLLVLT